jgi:hypothetical protein
VSADLQIELVPFRAANALSLQVSGGTAPAPAKVFQRAMLQIDDATLAAFRRGEIAAADLARLTTKVNDWLFDQELRKILTDSLAAAATNGGLGLVFVVPDEVRDMAAQMPLELLWHDTPDKPLVLRNDVQSLVYRLARTAPSPENPANRNWPLKVLIVRANPSDLGNTVPAVSELKQYILAKGTRYGPGMVEVDVISKETGIGRPATWRALRDHLESTNDYNILVYLGHGDLTPPPAGGQPIGHLFMESEDANGHLPVGAPQLAKLLSNYPIPCVLLAGCLTAAEFAGGAQGVAQALVNSSEAGVQVAVGTRIELRDQAAIDFLKAFFASLLGTQHPGDLDRAVWQGRNELFVGSGPYPPHWAAPIVLCANDGGRMIDFLAQPITFQVSAEMAKLLEVRAALWKSLPDLARAAPDRLAVFLPVLDQIEDNLRAEGVRHGPLLLPVRQQSLAGQPASLAVRLAGGLALSTLSGRIQIERDAADVRSIAIPPAVSNAGFQLLLDHADHGYFHLRSLAGRELALPEGELLRIELDVRQIPADAYPISLDLHRLEPRKPLWPGDNVLVVTQS